MNAIRSVSLLNRGSDVRLVPLPCLHLHLKWIALHDTQHERREAIVVLRGVASDRAEQPACRSTSARRPVPYVISFSVAVRTNTSERLSSACRRLAGPSSGVPSTSWLDASIGRAAIARAPPADQVEVLEREPDRIHDLDGTRAHVGFSRCISIFCAQRRRLWRLLDSSSSGGTFGGGSGGGTPSRFSSTHLPRDTGDVRFATDVTSRKLP